MGDIALWVVQGLAGLAFVAAGFQHGWRHERMKARPNGQWLGALPDNLRLFISVCEILGGIGLVLPMLTGILPWLTPLAGALLALVMLLAIGFHLMRREYPIIVLNAILLLLAAVVAYGRLGLLVQ